MKRILLTGANGYVGRHLEFELRLNPSYQVIPFDVYGNREAWKTKFKTEVTGFFDIIIHVGAIMNPAYDAPDIFWWNYECTKALARHAQQFPATQLIFFSSCMAINPVSHYGWSKRCAADLINEMLDNCCVVQPFSIFGDEAGRTSQYSPVCKLIRGELPYTFNPWIRDYIHVRDVIRGVKHIIEKDITGNYDLGTGQGTSTLELVEIWDGHRPPLVGPGETGWPPGAPEIFVARDSEMLPDFQTQYDVKSWLQELK